MRRNYCSANFRLLGVLLSLSLAATVMPFGLNASAQETTGANIEFLNPSNFSEVPPPESPDPQVPQQPGTIIVSDKPTQNPDTGPETYRLSAWVSGIPQNPAVEFELLTRQGVSLFIIDDVVRVGTDTFEADWDIPDTLPDGPYTLRATLAEGIIGIDNVDQDIVIQRLAERAEITYPDNRSSNGQYGMFVPLALTTGGDSAATSPNPVGNIENRTTTDAPGSGPGQIRAFYTTSQPGTRPDWKVCGTETGPGSYPFVDSSDGLRCTLENVQHLHLVTGVALVANNTKIGQPYDPSANQGGDATRTLEPYSQIPTTVEVVEGQSGEAEAGGSCFLVTASLTDQFSREVLGANMDAHAWGPNDRLKFGTGILGEWSREAPDRGGHAHEAGMDCWTGEEDNPEVGDEGEHQVIGGPDVKHIEADEDGTDDEGLWGFEAYLPEGAATSERRTTYWELWLDESNDGTGANNDSYDSLELCRSGLIGWDGPASSAPMTGTTPSCPVTPPPPPCETDPTASETDACPNPTGSPSPTPTTSPTQEPPAEEDEISITSNRSRVRSGRRVRFSGALDAAAECTSGRRVVLQSPRKGGTGFRKRASTVTDSEGAWSITRRLWRTKEWRAIARASGECASVVSRTITVKVRRN